MHKFISYAILLAVGTINVSATLPIQHNNYELIDKFNNWIKHFEVKIQNSDHLVKILDNWLNNDKFIEQTNLQNLTYQLGHNVYSGMNSDDFSEHMGFKSNYKLLSEFNTIRSLSPDLTDSIITSYNITAIPSSIDWRENGKVSHIKDQGQCGSCWAFSGTSTVESAVAIKTGNLYDLSEQQGVSCAIIKAGYSNMGCNGGMYNNLWNYIKDNGGLCTQDSYPYTSGTDSQTGKCIKTCESLTDTKVIDYKKVTPYSDSSMLTALNKQPISIALEADTRSFQLYKSGIYSDYSDCGGDSPQLDHAVVLVGYGIDKTNNMEYYIMRNSWGTSWGDQGYMKMARGDKYGKAGLCGLLSEPMYPVV